MRKCQTKMEVQCDWVNNQIEAVKEILTRCLTEAFNKMGLILFNCAIHLELV